MTDEQQVARRRRHQEVCERPLHGDERRQEHHGGNQRQEPVVDPSAAPLHHEVERECRHNQQKRKIGRHEAIDLHVDRPEHRLRRKQRQESGA
jgi:hypothetical protein